MCPEPEEESFVLKKTRILLVDDHPIVLDGLRSHLSGYSDFDVVGSAANGKEALARAKKLKPDLILMDISMPELNGIEAARVLKEKLPQINVMMLTMHDEPEYVRQMMASGARGYILKETTPAELVKAIRMVMKGGVWFSPKVTKIMMNDLTRSREVRKETKSTILTPREREVLGFVADGFSNKSIAKELNISVRTVETHRDRLMKKLNIHNAAALTRYAIAAGITSKHS